MSSLELGNRTSPTSKTFDIVLYACCCGETINLLEIIVQ